MSRNPQQCNTRLKREERQQEDLYCTPPYVVEELLRLETFQHHIWEPACGLGHISKVLENHGHDVRCTDLNDRGNDVLDFLGFDNTEPWYGDIITNPPYSVAGEFVERGLELMQEGAKMAMFLKLTFLEGAKRSALFDFTPPPPYGICIGQADIVRQRRCIWRKKRRLLCVVRVGEGVAWRHGNKMVQQMKIKNDDIRKVDAHVV